jgi:muramidase (phage lysozyme)
LLFLRHCLRRPRLRLTLAACLALMVSVPHPAGGQAVGQEPIQPETAQGDQRYALSDQRRALLETIRYAEGTWRNGSSDGYRTLYGGSLFQGLARYPEITVRRRYTSAAAGAYQFLPGTWREVAGQLRLRSFEPPNQDQAALHLIERRGALRLFDRQGLNREVVARLAPEWASLPTLRGSSHYGQPVKDYAELERFYGQALRRHAQS